MIPPAVAVWLPPLAVLGLFLVFAGTLTRSIRRHGLQRRPVLLTTALLGALMALYWGLVWVGVVDERVIRWERPALVLPCSIVVVAVAHRLLLLSPRQSRWRRALTELLLCASALTAALAVAFPRMSRPKGAWADRRHLARRTLSHACSRLRHRPRGLSPVRVLV